jgi:hypothetical protein
MYVSFRALLLALHSEAESCALHSEAESCALHSEAESCARRADLGAFERIRLLSYTH